MLFPPSCSETRGDTIFFLTFFFLNASLLEILARKTEEPVENQRNPSSRGPRRTVKSFEKKSPEKKKKKTRLNHPVSLTVLEEEEKKPFYFLTFFFQALHVFVFLIIQHTYPPWAFIPPSPREKDAGSNLGVRVSLGNDRGLQLPDHVQLHHPAAELQEHRQRAGGGRANSSAPQRQGGITQQKQHTFPCICR